MTPISAITKRLISLQQEGLADDVSSLHVVAAIVHELCAEIRRLEILGIEKDKIIHELQEARSLCGKSVFISRLQNWPRGYQGDFETIEYLCNGVNSTPPSTLEYYLEKIALSSPIVQQHNNKMLWQSQHILNAIYTNQNQNNERGILSIGSGGCRDLRLIEPALRTPHVRLIINDIDKDAIECSKEHLKSIWHKITPIHGVVHRKTREISKHSPFDLIVTGGLLDYLPDHYACMLIKKLITMLTKYGKICFTNILKPNPWRIWIEYLTDWHLIERTENDFRNMFDIYELDDLEIRMTQDRTGLAGLYEMTKQ